MANANDILKRLNEVFRDVFDDDDIVVTPKTTADDIEDWDSLQQITLTYAIEEHFGIRFTTDEIVGMKNVGDFVRVIGGKTT